MCSAAQTYPSSTEQHQTFLLLLLVLLLGSIRYDNPFMMYTTDGLVSKTANTLWGYHTHFLDDWCCWKNGLCSSSSKCCCCCCSSKEVSWRCYNCDSWKHFVVYLCTPSLLSYSKFFLGWMCKWNVVSSFLLSLYKRDIVWAFVFCVVENQTIGKTWWLLLLAR